MQLTAKHAKLLLLVAGVATGVLIWLLLARPAYDPSAMFARGLAGEPPWVAAERNVRRVWAEHRVRLEAGSAPLVPAAVVAQASRSPKQAQLRRLLRGCEVVLLDEGAAHRAGALLGRAHTSDITDASVVVLATGRKADIVTNDLGDIQRLVAAAGATATVIGV